jgi:hypothetical protein
MLMVDATLRRGGGVTALGLEKGKGPQMSEPVPREHMSPYLNENKGSICPYLLFLS